MGDEMSSDWADLKAVRCRGACDDDEEELEA